jgi:hypothetical protein
VVHLLPGLDVFAVGALQVALDRVVLEVDDGLLLVLDPGLGLALLLLAEPRRGRSSSVATTSLRIGFVPR